MVKKVNTQEFAAEAMKAPVAVVDFNATWCGPCRMLAPVLEDISEKYEGKVSFFSVDVDECPEIAESFNISSIPTLIMFKNGEVAGQRVGGANMAVLEAFINENA